jgi:hypothetical protein
MIHRLDLNRELSRFGKRLSDMYKLRFGFVLAAVLLPSVARGQSLLDAVAWAVESEKLGGNWIATEGLRAGKAMPKEELVKVHFSMNSLHLEPYGSVFLTLNPKFRQFSFCDSVGFGGGHLYRGFYEVKGDMLRVCVATFPSTGYFPALASSYEEAATGPYILLTFRRDPR